MANSLLKPKTAFGDHAPRTVDVGPIRIMERFDVALASLATRRGREKAVAKAAKSAKLPLPEPACAIANAGYSAFWLSPQQWMVEAPYASHEDIAAVLKTIFADAASITEQTDAWVRLDISADDLPSLFERLCNVDLRTAPVGHAVRTVIEHMGCYLIKRQESLVTLYGPRSMAASLLHVLEVTAHSIK